MKNLISMLLDRLQFVFFVFFLIALVLLGSGKSVNYAANLSGATRLNSSHFVDKYNNSDSTLETRYVSNMDEVREFGAISPVLFVGQMTAYGPDCVGCTGKVACPPRQDVRNGNVNFNDSEYGSVRILAADSAIPCGSMIKINNLSYTNDDVYGIVLDRGGAIKGNIIDFLVASEADSDSVGRQKNVNFEIVRWGW